MLSFLLLFMPFKVAPPAFAQAYPQHLHVCFTSEIFNACLHACLFAAGDASQKLRRLGRELRDLRGKTKLPVAAAAACFVRQDAERPDKVRCCASHSSEITTAEKSWASCGYELLCAAGLRAGSEPCLQEQRPGCLAETSQSMPVSYATPYAM
jgi:hypothetical protein